MSYLIKPLLLCVLFFSVNSLFAQKQPLDFTAQENWPQIKDPKLSNNGKYVMFSVELNNTLPIRVIKSLSDGKVKEIPQVLKAVFTEDSKRVLCQLFSDTIAILELDNGKCEYITNTEGFTLQENGDGQWIAYRLKNDKRTVIIRNLQTGIKKQFDFVSEILFSENGNELAILEIDPDQKGNAVILLDLRSESRKTIWKGYAVSNLVIDQSGSRLAFISAESEKGGVTDNSIVYFHKNMDRAKIILTNLSPRLNELSITKSALSFTADGNHLFFSAYDAKLQDKMNRSDTGVRVKLWSYKDDVLSERGTFARSYRFTVDVNYPAKIFRLESQADDCLVSWDLTHYRQKHVLVRSNCAGNASEYTWRPKAKQNLFLVSIQDGSRKLLDQQLINANINVQLSPSGKYALWYNRKERQWRCHNVRDNKTKSICENIPGPLYSEHDFPGLPDAEGIVGWAKDEAAIFIYDRNDIWRVDPNGIQSPINITREYGRQHNIRFRYLSYPKDMSQPLIIGDSLLLSAFDINTKYSGYIKVPSDGSFTFSDILMQPLSSFNRRYSPAITYDVRHILPVKAKNADIYLLNRMSPVEYPNLYTTTDFTHFKALSNLAPQKAYNWYTSELVNYQLSNNKDVQGVLYKPEDFDATKKYPLIFYYYEKSSDALNAFIEPGLSTGPINIPWFVSNGYLVFVPDIHYTRGYPGKSALDAVISSVQHLSKRPYIDTTKMGLQGHSFGGFETDYIVTHTSKFAAAVSSAGFANSTSFVGDLVNASGRHEYFEVRQGNIGASLWDRPDLYIENSPIFHAYKVTTPILILQNKQDNMVTPEQGLQWFTALRRLGKKAWLIQYDDEYHNVTNPKNQLDYSIRLAQFFDHYLKDKPAPEWMRGTED